MSAPKSSKDKEKAKDQMYGVIDLLPALNAAPANIRQKTGPVGAPGSSLNLQLQKDKDFMKVYKTEAAAREYYHKGVVSLNEARKIALKELPQASLPMTIRRMKDQVQSNERSSHNYAKLARQLARELKEPVAEGVQETALDRVRLNLGVLLDEEANHLADAAVDLNQERKDEEVNRLRKLLPYAYPSATSQEIERALINPEVAEMALLRGAHKAGSENLNVMVARLESSKEALEKRVEDESIAIEMLFGKFDQITANQEHQLDDVEQDVFATLDEIDGALDNLKEARNLKVGNVKRKICCGIILFLLGFYIFWWLIGSQLMDKFNLKPEEPLPPPPEVTQAPKNENGVESILGDSETTNTKDKGEGDSETSNTKDKGEKTSLLSIRTLQFAVDDGAHLKKRVRKARRFMA